MQHKCDLINMSYGEPTLLPDYGRFIDLVNEVCTQNLLHLQELSFSVIFLLCSNIVRISLIFFFPFSLNLGCE